MTKQFSTRWFVALLVTILMSPPLMSSTVQAADYGGYDGYADGPGPYLSGGQEPYYENRGDDDDDDDEATAVPEDRYSYRDGGRDFRDDDDDDYDRNRGAYDDDGDIDDDDGYEDQRGASYDRYREQGYFRGPQAGHRDRCLPSWQVKQRLEAEGWTGFRLAQFGEGIATLRAHRRQTNRPFWLKIDGCDGHTISSRPIESDRRYGPDRQVRYGYKD